MVIVMGHAKMAAGEIDRLKDVIAAQLAATNAEDGCLHYSFARHVLDPDTLVISERWRDSAAIDRHFASPHMAAFNTALSAAKILDISVKAYENDQVRVLMGS